MADNKYKPVTFRIDKWQLLADLAADMSTDKGVKVTIPEAVETAVLYFNQHIKETK